MTRSNGTTDFGNTPVGQAAQEYSEICKEIRGLLAELQQNRKEDTSVTVIPLSRPLLLTQVVRA